MKIIRVTYFALVAVLSVVSCSKETTEPDVYEWIDGKIYFKTSISDVVSSRAQDMTLDRLESFQVTCFNSEDTDKDGDGFIDPYFQNATFVRKETPVAITFESSPAEGPRDWPDNNGLIRFFAFSPSLDVMESDNSAIAETERNNYFKLINASSKTDSKLMTDYRLGAIRVNPDIDKQFDFVTAETSGYKFKDFTAGVDIAFSHQMSQVELRAWGNQPKYNFEIAGVRIGNPVVEDYFVFADSSDQPSSGRWENSESSAKDKVEYIYQGADSDSSGDIVYNINNSEHNTPQTAGSIMGRGGCAMVIPTFNQRWEGLSDPDIEVLPYTTDRMYFSILMRVTSAINGKQVYPYPKNPDGLKIVYYAVDKDGVISARVYPGVKEGTFFTDSNLQQPYVAEKDTEIKEFGWAAVPVEADWSAGKRYVYTLDYSEGIGLHDPEDPKPGTPIIGQQSVAWGVNVTSWGQATPDDNYIPDLEVP